LRTKRGLPPPYLLVSALPHQQSRIRLGCDLLRGEPAITQLDWSFAPSPRSCKRIAYQNCFRPPPRFPVASPCPGLDRWVSGVIWVTTGRLGPRSWQSPLLGTSRATTRRSKSSAEADDLERTFTSRCSLLRTVGFPSPPTFDSVLGLPHT
jgi:hypothetical protein